LDGLLAEEVGGAAVPGADRVVADGFGQEGQELAGAAAAEPGMVEQQAQGAGLGLFAVAVEELLLGEALGERAEQGVVGLEHDGPCSAFLLLVPAVQVGSGHPLT
jgi:hypothetical protein